MRLFGNLGRRLGVWTLLGAWLAGPALALDAKTVRDIERTDSAEKLASLADKIASDAATRQPKEFQEGTQIATETNTYLLYIIVKQNALLLKEQEQN
ncbi:MAG TPA: hypothetical protein VK997_04260 [Deferrisomatales bacterium]|nr:hypothetical protein [Deferrisomatales bacterium]